MRDAAQSVRDNLQRCVAAMLPTLQQRYVTTAQAACCVRADAANVVAQADAKSLIE